MTHSDALRIAAEVRECFEQAKRDTEEMARKLAAASADRATSKAAGAQCVRCNGQGRIGPDEWCPSCLGKGTR